MIINSPKSSISIISTVSTVEEFQQIFICFNNTENNKDIKQYHKCLINIFVGKLLMANMITSFNPNLPINCSPDILSAYYVQLHVFKCTSDSCDHGSKYYELSSSQL